jgi:hypothetical protein
MRHRARALRCNPDTRRPGRSKPEYCSNWGGWPTLDPLRTMGAPSFALLRRVGEHEPCPASVGSPVSIEEESPMRASSACKVQSTVPGELRGSGNQSQWAATAGCVKLPPVGAHWEWRDTAVKILIGRKPMRTLAVLDDFCCLERLRALGRAVSFSAPAGYGRNLPALDGQGSARSVPPCLAQRRPPNRSVIVDAALLSLWLPIRWRAKLCKKSPKTPN